MTYEEFRAAFALMFGSASDVDGYIVYLPARHGIEVDILRGDKERLGSIVGHPLPPPFAAMGNDWQRYILPCEWFVS